MVPAADAELTDTCSAGVLPLMSGTVTRHST
jgi:hypothetical protein